MEGYRALYDRAFKDPEAFWADIASSELHWFERWTKVLDWNPPFAKWFVGGKINVSYNCLDRHLTTARKNKAAILWEGEPGEQRCITYQELHRLVVRFHDFGTPVTIEVPSPVNRMDDDGTGRVSRADPPSG